MLLDDAARLLLASGTESMTVVHPDGSPAGKVTLKEILAAMVAEGEGPEKLVRYS